MQERREEEDGACPGTNSLTTSCRDGRDEEEGSSAQRKECASSCSLLLMAPADNNIQDDKPHLGSRTHQKPGLNALLLLPLQVMTSFQGDLRRRSRERHRGHRQAAQSLQEHEGRQVCSTLSLQSLRREYQARSSQKNLRVPVSARRERCCHGGEQDAFSRRFPSLLPGRVRYVFAMLVFQISS